MKTKESFLLIVCFFLGANAFAQGAKAPGTGPNPFSECGIGAALFPTIHWAAVSSNVIWDVGTTAVTSATMSPQTCSGKSAVVAQFIIDNYAVLEEETAKGQGEYLTAMFDVLGCSDVAVLSTELRSEMAVKVTDSAYADYPLVDKASSYYTALELVLSRHSSSVCTI